MISKARDRAPRRAPDGRGRGRRRRAPRSADRASASRCRRRGPAASRARRTSGGTGSMSRVTGIARFWSRVAASRSTALGVTMPKRSREAEPLLAVRDAGGAAAEDDDLPFIGNRRAGHEIDEHFGRARVEAGYGHPLSFGNRQIVQAQRPEAVVGAPQLRDLEHRGGRHQTARRRSAALDSLSKSSTDRVTWPRQEIAVSGGAVEVGAASDEQPELQREGAVAYLRGRVVIRVAGFEGVETGGGERRDQVIARVEAWMCERRDPAGVVDDRDDLRRRGPEPRDVGGAADTPGSV